MFAKGWNNMVNKILIGVVIFLIILTSGLGYFSYTLNTQLDRLDEWLAVFQEEQTEMITGLSGEITELGEETSREFGTLQDELQSKTSETLAEVGALKTDIGENAARLDALGSEISKNTASIDSVKDEVEGVTADVFQSVMDASKIYPKVKDATVRISDGVRVRGSGFIYDRQAHVVTAQHVVKNLSPVYVILPDGRVSTVTVVGGSGPSDVAVLKLDEEFDVEPLTIADSAAVVIGEPVAAIGNPFEIGETLTIGIVSQKDRFVDINTDSETQWVANLIQFDAAVNFGNSGCALFNSAGEVIGMVIARIGPDEGDGINYAVSSNKIKRVANSIIAKGYFDYPWLGMNITNLTPEIVQSRNLQTSHGVLVDSVLAGGPAHSDGVRDGDVILAVDGLTIEDSSHFTAYLGENNSPGDRVLFKIKRGDESMEIFVELGIRPA